MRIPESLPLSDMTCFTNEPGEIRHLDPRLSLSQANQETIIVQPIVDWIEHPCQPCETTSYKLDSLPNGNLFAVWGASFSFPDFEPAYAPPLPFGVSLYGNQVLIESSVIS